MQMGESTRTWSLGVATAFMMFAGAAVAQTSQPDQSWNLTGVNTRLVHSLDSGSARQGEPVAVSLDGSVKTDQGLKFSKGTELKGTVTNVEKSSNGGPSKVTLNFNQAQMKDGKTVPVKVTLLAAFPPSVDDEASYGFANVSPAPRHVNAQEKIDQQTGALGNVSLHSQVQGDNSGTFEKQDGDLKLKAGTYLQVGIAATNGNASSTSGL